MRGGWAERVIQNLAKILLEQKKEVYLFTLTDILFYDIPKEVHYIPISTIKNKYILFFLIPIFSIKFRILLKKYKLNEWISFLETSNYIHILSKKNAYISLRIHVDIYQWISWKIHKFLIKRLYPKAWKIIVNSRENKYELMNFIKVPKDKIEVMYNPIDKERIKTLSKEKVDVKIKEKLKSKRVFITTWRLVRQKQHEKIIKSLYKYNKINEDRIYLIVWDWPEREKLEKLVINLWLKDKIMFLWQQKNVFKFLKLADIFLYASKIEWFPNVLLEARELWIKIITSDFKSWAREVILWEDTDTIGKELSYPVEWKYWILVSNELFIKQTNLLLKNSII